MRFDEHWIHDNQLEDLAKLAASTSHLDGEVVEIGVWQGLSTVRIMKSTFPNVVHAVDHWLGDSNGRPGWGIDPEWAATRDNEGIFRDNAREAGGNVIVHKMDWREFVKHWNQPIRFLHIDATHTADEVSDNIEALLPFMVYGGIIAGDDINIDEVAIGVRRQFGSAFSTTGNMWWKVIGHADDQMPCGHPVQLLDARGCLKCLLPSHQQLAYGLETSAAILHAPSNLGGDRSELWEPVKAKFFRDEYLKNQFTDDPDLTFITYNTHGTPGVLERCLEYIGIRNVVVLGADLTDAEWNWGYKVTLLNEYLLSGACQTKYIACLDDDDVLVFDPTVIVRRFLESGGHMLFCRGGNWPPNEDCRVFEEKNYPGGKPGLVHINANYVGEREYIAEKIAQLVPCTTEPSFMYWFRPCKHEYGFDDQLAWRRFQQFFWPEIRTDVLATLFTELK